MFQTNVLEKTKHILCQITFFPYNPAVYEIMWEKYRTARQAADDNIVRRTRIACWLPKVTDTHSEYIILEGGLTVHLPHEII